MVVLVVVWVVLVVILVGFSPVVSVVACHYFTIIEKPTKTITRTTRITYCFGKPHRLECDEHFRRTLLTENT